MLLNKLKVVFVMVLATALVTSVGCGAGKEPLAKRGPPAKADQIAPTEWPEKSVVTGRVLNHQGVAVANAEVLLLGEEQIMVDADRRAWFVVPTEKGKLPDPPTTRTNEKGEFSIERGRGPANRLAVISSDPLFWVVSQKSLSRGDNVVVQLPQAGSLAIHCDIPGKPKTQPVMVQLQSFDGVEWNIDRLRFSDTAFSIKNPGETVFDFLPPGRYSVERSQEIRLGQSQVLMNFADRQLAKVESDKRVVVRIDRKVGRPVTGQVRGLEKIDLRHAHVTIHYFGPEEGPTANGKRTRHLTTFDVIPIMSDGIFTTDPIPPGKYSIDLFAVRSTTSNPSQSDFTCGRFEFTVPTNGDTPRIDVIAKPRPPR